MEGGINIDSRGERKEEKDREIQGEADEVRQGRDGGEEREGEGEGGRHIMEGGERGKKKESHETNIDIEVRSKKS